MKLRSKFHMEPYLLNKYWGAGVGSQIKSGVRLPGTTGNYISTPDSVLNSITGDIDIRVYAKAVNWNTGAPQTLIGKLNTTGNQRSYRLVISATGSLDLTVCTDGLLSSNVSTVAAPGFVNNQAIWIRATAQMNDGAGHHVGQIFTSSDGVTWTSVANNVNGGTFATGPILNIFDSTALLEIGSRDGGTQDLFAGTIYYAEVRNGIDGPIAARFDSSQVQVSGSLLPASINGWTWNGSSLYKVDDYVRLPGTSGNYLSFPDTVANSVTGDLDLRVHLAADDYTPASNRVLFAKEASTIRRSWRLETDPTNMVLMLSPDGSDGTKQAATASTPVDGSSTWIRVTWRQSDGRVQFFLSPDGVTYTQTGTDKTLVIASIFDSDSPLEIGANFLGTSKNFAGNVYYAEVRNGINGPVVASFDGRSVQTPWTINGSGWNWEGSSFTGKPGIALSLPGTSGNYVSTPDTAGNSIVGDIDIRAKIAPTVWNPATFFSIASKYVTAGNQRAFDFFLDNFGTLELVASTDGTVFPTAVSSVVVPFATGATGWVRVTRVSATGVCAFYTSIDGVVWTPLGTPQTITSGALFDSSGVLEIGSRLVGTSRNFQGNIFYAEVRNGIDGPIVAMFDPARMAKTGTRTPASTVQPGGSPNMLTPNQASIETDATGWAVDANSTLAQDATQFLDGTHSLSITSVAAGDANAKLGGVFTALPPVVAGKFYRIAASFKAAVSPRTCNIGVRWFDVAGAQVGSINTTSATDSTSVWTEAANSFMAPATAVYAMLVAKAIATGGAAEVHNVDRISIVEAAEVWTINGAAWDLVAV